jgi:Flp pilus assembly pilin Flp
VLPVLGVATIVAGVAAGILTQLALRYGVIYDITFGEAIKRSWDDLWGKKGAFMFWLVMLLPGFAFALAVIVVMMPFLVPGVLLLMRGEYAVGAVLIALMVLAMFLPQAIYSTFVSSAWTVFFRRMTGLEPSPAAVRAAGPPPVAPYAPVPAEPPSVPPSPAAPAPFVVPEEAPIVDVPPPDRPPSDG